MISICVSHLTNLGAIMHDFIIQLLSLGEQMRPEIKKNAHSLTL